jgi:hypothetical protein
MIRSFKLFFGIDDTSLSRMGLRDAKSKFVLHLSADVSG